MDASEPRWKGTIKEGNVNLRGYSGTGSLAPRFEDESEINPEELLEVSYQKVKKVIWQLIQHFKKPEEETKDQIPEGLCPVCWGYQEYDYKIRKLYRDKQVDVNNHRASYMIIEDFVVNHLKGIQLKESKIDSCPTCS